MKGSMKWRRNGDEHQAVGRLPLDKCNSYSYVDGYRVMGLLFEELIVEILCRLPQKALIQFKCVSKHWYCLISEVCVPRISPLPLSGISRVVRISEGLIRGEYYPMPNDTPLDQEFTRRNDDIWDWDYRHTPPVDALRPDSRELLDICNGLSLFFHPSNNLYCIWNFTTDQFVYFPPPPPPVAAACASFGFQHAKKQEKNQNRTTAIFSALAFDPKQSLHFKVVRFGRPRSTLNPGVRPLSIFSSETREWVEYTVDVGPPPIDTARLARRCVYLNQALYRLSMSLHLLRYDLDIKLNVTAIKLPDVGSLTPPHTFDNIGCIGSSLGRRLYYARPDATKVLIWILCDASDWVLMHSIRTQDLINYELGIEGLPRDRKETFREIHGNWGRLKLKRLFDSLPHLQPVAFDSTSDAVILWALGIFLWYHLDSGKLEMIYYMPSCFQYDTAVLNVFPFSRCLVPLKDLGWNHHVHDTRTDETCFVVHPILVLPWSFHSYVFLL
ncbi:uncharacterized protein LOC131307486 isoform X2 [Rhododendron vialii]|uniref:uncharacterized protein LOC131307486 isoform X2 n=1 Tax=Rhododendron vialii TaxID=182163 RepID=UPI00265E4B6C|nr:uncharacterized protein LOC131307486 isoform X2 [Rhododendron vialii]